MKLACSRCNQISEDGHLWCQLVDCPAGNVPEVLTYGEYLGDIQIQRLLRLFRTAAVYEATRFGEPVLLKIAHDGHQDLLKREASLLAEIATTSVPGLPQLLPPYRGAAPTYGKAVFRGKVRYYEVFRYISGIFLRDWLLENPEPWYLHAAWITAGVSHALSEVHTRCKVLHLNATPDIILLHFDNERIPRVTLLDLGALVGENDLPRPGRQRRDEILGHVTPAYAPPELLIGGDLSNAGDVYGVGLLFYEMLAGKPVYLKPLQSDTEMAEQVKNMRETLTRLTRSDMPKPDEVHQLISQALEKDPRQRPTSVTTLRDQIEEIFGEVPVPRQNPWRNAPVLLGLAAVMGGILFILGLLVVALIP